MNDATVIGALRRFIPELLSESPSLNPQQRRAIWAITHCRTPAMGGRRFVCVQCGSEHFAYHSCNHKACPQCGLAATRQWVRRELGKQIGAPYFLVTFTLPEQLRCCFIGPFAKELYRLFFAAAAGALHEKLAMAKGLQAEVNGFTAILHTWNQRLEFHPHIHMLVPGAGIDGKGKVVAVRKADYLVHLPLLQGAFRQHFRRHFEAAGWEADPVVWSKHFGVHIQPVGSGAAALKYLGTYVCRTAIADGRIVAIGHNSVTFRWKDRSDNNRVKILTLSGVEFARRYLRHVLPRGLRSIRYYGFCHPSAIRKRERIRIHTGMPINLGKSSSKNDLNASPCCPRCSVRMTFSGKLPKLVAFVPIHSRAPPALCTAA